MASLARALSQIQGDLESLLSASFFEQVCREAGHHWQQRFLDPAGARFPPQLFSFDFNRRSVGSIVKSRHAVQQPGSPTTAGRRDFRGRRGMSVRRIVWGHEREHNTRMRHRELGCSASQSDFTAESDTDGIATFTVKSKEHLPEFTSPVAPPRNRRFSTAVTNQVARR